MSTGCLYNYQFDITKIYCCANFYMFAVMSHFLAPVNELLNCCVMLLCIVFLFQIIKVLCLVEFYRSLSFLPSDAVQC